MSLPSSVDVVAGDLRPRKARGLTHVEVAHFVGVASSTIRRYSTAADAEADGVLARIGWLGAEPEAFVATSTVSGALLPFAHDGQIRVDMDLVDKLPESSRRRRIGTRTTIQQLVIAAQAERN